MNLFFEWKSSFSDIECCKFTLPKLPNYDKIKLIEKEDDVFTSNKKCDFIELPFAVGNIFEATLTVTKRIVRSDNKEVISATLEAPEINSIEYSPGDTLGIMPENSDEVVGQVLQHIGRTDDADKSWYIVNDDPKKNYLPRCSTLRELFKRYVNLRGIPLKQLLAALAEFTEDETEKRKLQFLCCKEGMLVYKSVIMEPGTDFFTVLTSFKTCRPPPEVLIFLLPRLLPRPYSIATSKLASPSKMRIVFSILPPEQEGLTTGMVRRLLSDANHAIVNAYLRKSHGFCLPEDDTVPLILAGPGTGVAPFLGFLDHLHHRKIHRTIYLFTGFRHKCEFIFREELHQHLENFVLTKLFVSYSAEGEDHKYVQDNIKQHWEELGSLIIDNGGYIYDCGDHQRMKESVLDAFMIVIHKYLGCNMEDAKAKMEDLQLKRRYRRDVWC